MNWRWASALNITLRLRPLTVARLNAKFGVAILACPSTPVLIPPARGALRVINITEIDPRALAGSSGCAGDEWQAGRPTRTGAG